MFSQERGENPKETRFLSRYLKSFCVPEAPFGVSGRRILEKEKGSSSPFHAAAAKSQPFTKEQDWKLVEKKRKRDMKKNDMKKEQTKVQVTSKKQEKVKEKTPRSSFPTRLRNAIRVSVKDGQSYVVIVKEMKAKVKPLEAELEVLSMRWARYKKSTPELINTTNIHKEIVL